MAWQLRALADPAETRVLSPEPMINSLESLVAPEDPMTSSGLCRHCTHIPAHTHTYRQLKIRDWRGSSVIKIIYQSCRGPNISCQNPHQVAHNFCKFNSRDLIFLASTGSCTQVHTHVNEIFQNKS